MNATYSRDFLWSLNKVVYHQEKGIHVKEILQVPHAKFSVHRLNEMDVAYQRTLRRGCWAIKVLKLQMPIHSALNIYAKLEKDLTYLETHFKCLTQIIQ